MKPTYVKTPALTVDHNAYQANITDAGKIMGWKFLHVRKSIGKGKQWQTTTSIVGWPDLFGFHPEHGTLAIEVKVGKDKPTAEQLSCLHDLAAAGVRTLIAYPSDWDVVVAALAGKWA